jgi:fermentation-respiration switch protein FrsA (DUF1100 family)
MPQVKVDTVRFPSGNKQLLGHLFRTDAEARGVLVTGSWTTVKEQMADLYARRLAEQGFTTLSFDFANFGESEGEPREFEDPASKIADIVAAARWLAAQGDVVGDTIGGLAVCASAGYMVEAIAAGAPISAFATVAAWLHDAGTVGQVYGGDEGVAAKKRTGEDALSAYRASGEVRYVPAYSDTDPDAAMGEMVKTYYGNSDRGAVPEWRNRFAVMSWPGWLGFDPIRRAPELRVPTLMVHSDGAAFPDNARRFEAALAGPHRLFWTDGTQLDFYDQPKQMETAVREAAGHFRGQR